MKRDARIVAIAPNWLGDAVMALSALGDVREEFGAATLAVAARPSIAPLFEMVRGIDEVVTLDSGRAATVSNVAALERGRFDLAMLFPNSFASAWMTARARIPERWGYRADWRTRWLTRAVPRPAGGHQVAYYRDLVRALGIGPAREPLLVVVSDAPAHAARERLRSMGWDGASPLVAVAPGAAYGTAKQWPPEYFAALVGDLCEHDGATVVLVGTVADARVGKAIVSGLRAPGPGPDDARMGGPRMINLIGETDLKSLAATLVNCNALVSNDSGAMHLAAALGVPVTAIFGPTNERETAPRRRPGGPEPRIVFHEVFCRPCMLRECPIDHRCMRGIDPARAAEACRAGMPDGGRTTV